MKIKRLFNYKILLGLIVLVGLWLRVVNLRSWFHFMMDEETIAWKVKPFLTSGKPFLIGGGTPFGFHLGPFFYYLSSIPLYFSNLDPIGWGMVAAVFGMMTITAIWLVGKELFSPRIGLIAALLWATSVTPILLDRHWWPLVLDPLFTLLVVFSLAKVLKGRRRWWIVVGLTLAAAWQADLSTLVLFIAAAVVGLIKIKTDIKYIFLTGIIVAISFLPLLIFEIRHPGVNLGKAWQEFVNKPPPGCVGDCPSPIQDSLTYISSTLASSLVPMGSFDGNIERFYSWCQPWAQGRLRVIPPLAGLLAVGLLAFAAYQHRLVLIMSGSVMIGIVIFRSYGGDLYDFYLTPFFPVMVLAVAEIIGSWWIGWKRFVAMAILLAIMSLNGIIFSRLYHPQGLELKQAAVAWATNQVGDKDFALESISGCSRFNGVRYLFMLQGKEPTMSFMDPSFSWLYHRPPEADRPRLLVVFTTPNDIPASAETRYNQLVRDSLAVKQFGDLTILVVNNDSKIHRINL